MSKSKMSFKEFLYWAQITEEQFEKADDWQRTNWGTLAHNARRNYREKIRARLNDEYREKVAAIRKGEKW